MAGKGSAADPNHVAIDSGAVGFILDTSVYNKNGAAVAVQRADINHTADGESGDLIAAPGAGSKIMILGYVLFVTGTGVSSLIDGPAGAVKQRLRSPGAAVSPTGLQVAALAENTALRATNAAGTDLEGQVFYAVIPI